MPVIQIVRLDYIIHSSITNTWTTGQILQNPLSLIAWMLLNKVGSFSILWDSKHRIPIFGACIWACAYLVWNAFICFSVWCIICIRPQITLYCPNSYKGDAYYYNRSCRFSERRWVVRVNFSNCRLHFSPCFVQLTLTILSNKFCQDARQVIIHPSDSPRYQCCTRDDLSCAT